MYCRIIPSQHGSDNGIAWHSTSFSHRFRGGTGIADAIENGLNFGAQTDPLAPVAVMKCNAAVPIILLLLLAGSGCAALIYEIVWLQLLQLVIGSSAVSLGLLLAAYMGGLCLGSAALPRVISARHDPSRVYALLELGIGVLGFIVLFAVPVVGRVYLAGATQGIAGLVLRGLIAAVCLVPPTILMGASLPAAGRWMETTPQGVSRLGLLYSANIAGAVFGCLLAGFYLLRVHDMAIATYVVASISLILVSRVKHKAADPPITPPAPSLAPGATLVYIAIAVSGLCALGAE